MKPFDPTLQRLLDAAARATPEPAGAPPLGLETRVLAQWRAAEPEDESTSLFVLCRRAMLGAGLVLALCAAWSLAWPGASPPGDEAALLDYEIQTSLNP